MTRRTSLLAVLLAAGCLAHVADIGTWPYLVTIHYNVTGNGSCWTTVPFCAGVLLDPKWVLTAAHCVRPSFNGREGDAAVLVRTGAGDMTAEAAGAYVPCRGYFKHPEYRHDEFKRPRIFTLVDRYDVGLMLLGADAPNVTTFPNVSERDARPGAGVVCGWGVESLWNFSESAVQNPARQLPARGRLYETEVSIEVDGMCQVYLEQLNNFHHKQFDWNGKVPAFGLTRRQVRESFFCTSTPESAFNYAPDSGGPLFCSGELCGIATVVADMSVFTRVAPYVPWIRTVMGLEGNAEMSTRSVGTVVATRTTTVGPSTASTASSVAARRSTETTSGRKATTRDVSYADLISSNKSVLLETGLLGVKSCSVGVLNVYVFLNIFFVTFFSVFFFGFLRGFAVGTFGFFSFRKIV